MLFLQPNIRNLGNFFKILRGIIYLPNVSHGIRSCNVIEFRPSLGLFQLKLTRRRPSMGRRCIPMAHLRMKVQWSKLFEA